MRLGALALGQLRAALGGVAVALRAQQRRLQVGHALRGLRALRLDITSQNKAGAAICIAELFAEGDASALRGTETSR